MKQKLLILFAALLCSTMMFADAVKIGDFYYTLSDLNETAELLYHSDNIGIGYNVGWDITAIDIPTSVEHGGTTYQVTTIGNYAFANCEQLNEIDVASDNPYFCSVDGVLYSKDMTELVVCPRSKAGAFTIPNSVTKIHAYAFEYCVNLTSVIIGDGVKRIGLCAFAFCFRMENVTIGSSVEQIDYLAFEFCESLKEITLPNSVTSLGNRAFSYCANLNTINIGSGLKNIADENPFKGLGSLTAFNVSPDNPNLCSVDGVLFKKNMKTLYAYPCLKALADEGSYIVPDGVVEIWSGAFFGVQTLNSITIPASVLWIYRDAFNSCSLQSITFKGKKCYYFCFENLLDLRDVYCLADEVSVFPINSYLFADCYLEYATLHVPETLIEKYRTTEPWSGFGNIIALTDEEMPPAPEVYTVYNDWRQVLTYYYDDQRESRSGVTELYDPNAVRFADYHDKVRTVYIDQSMLDAPLTSMEKMFYGGFSKKPLYLSKMTSIEGLENLNTENVTSMQSMFEGCQSLTELDLSTFNTANVTSTNCMFQSCSNLETLNIALFNIGKMEDMRYMFSGCSKLKTIYCNSDWNGSEAQSGYMFSGCSALEGGQGTKFNSSVIDKTYARTDDPANDKPGYFTVVESVPVTISAMEWATFVAPYALSFSDVDGLTAYIITGHTGSTVETVEVYDVPANTPVLLNGSANTYSIPVIAGSATDVSGNKLVAGTGAKVAAEAGKTKYVLSTEADDVVFKIITTTPATVAKSKAYLMFDEVVESRQLTFGHDATGIEASPESSFEGKNLWYDLQGRRLEGMPTRKGLYIVNGKKYLVK